MASDDGVGARILYAILGVGCLALAYIFYSNPFNLTETDGWGIIGQVFVQSYYSSIAIAVCTFLGIIFLYLMVKRG